MRSRHARASSANRLPRPLGPAPQPGAGPAPCPGFRAAPAPETRASAAGASAPLLVSGGPGNTAKQGPPVWGEGKGENVFHVPRGPATQRKGAWGSAACDVVKAAPRTTESRGRQRATGAGCSSHASRCQIPSCAIGDPEPDTLLRRGKRRSLSATGGAMTWMRRGCRSCQIASMRGERAGRLASPGRPRPLLGWRCHHFSSC